MTANTAILVGKGQQPNPSCTTSRPTLARLTKHVYESRRLYSTIHISPSATWIVRIHVIVP